MSDATYTVMVRMPRDGSQPLAEILWPFEPATTTPGGAALLWSRIGQHGAADIGRWVGSTRPATVAEQAAAIAQWRSEGPDRGPENVAFRVVARTPRWRNILGAHKATLGLY